MADNLLKSLSSFVTPDLISKATSILGESETGISKGMSFAIPSLLGGLASKADNTDVMDGLMGLVNQKGFDADKVLADLPSLLTDKGPKSVLDSGSSMLNMIFGNKKSGIFDMLAKSAGIKNSSVLKLMGMVAPMAMGYLKKSGFNASSLAKALFSQKNEITSNLPKGMDSLMGFGDKMGGEGKKAMDKAVEPVPEKPKNKWLWPLIIIAAVLLLFYLMRDCSGNEPAAPASNQIETDAIQATFGKATQEELDASYELGANPDAETIAKFQEKAGKTFEQYRGYCYEEEAWLNAAWQMDRAVAGAAAEDHKAKTGHNTGVRWK